MSAVESVIRTHRNSDLIQQVAPLWLKGKVLDATYGLGGWWDWPANNSIDLVSNDLFPQTYVDHSFDFRGFPLYWQDTFDAVCFDPPYIAKGGRDTSGITDFDGRYGLRDAPKDPAALWVYIGAGVGSCARVVKPGGVVLVKCMDYISSGQYQFGLGEVNAAALMAGLTLVDLFIHASRPGPQPKGRRQVHSRRSHSYLVVFQKPKRRR